MFDSQVRNVVKASSLQILVITYYSFCEATLTPTTSQVIPFANGEPVAAANNNTAATDIFANADNSVCPDNCFRPVGIAFDNQGRLFMSSDASGEIFVVVKDEASNGSNPNGSGPSGKPTSGAQFQLMPQLALCIFAALAGFIVL